MKKLLTTDSMVLMKKNMFAVNIETAVTSSSATEYTVIIHMMKIEEDIYEMKNTRIQWLNIWRTSSSFLFYILIFRKMTITKETFIELANKMLESDDVQIYSLNNSIEYSLD